MNTEEMTQREKAVWDRLVTVYDAADDEDRAQVRELVERAKTGNRDTAIINLRPGAAAILFFDYNKQNREWKGSITEEYATTIEMGEFEFTNQGIGFLDSGKSW